MQIKCTEFSDQQMIPVKYTCKGDNINPPLVLSQVPKNARSLALTVFDPDSPSGNFVHWLMWNIDPNIKQIEPGRAPTGATQGVNDFGNPSYGGPCPHQGTHRYVFSLFAIDTTLNIPQTTTREDLLAKIQPQIIEQTELTGVFAADNR